MAVKSFEAENEEKRNRDGHNKNVLKWYGVKCTDEVFYVGSLDSIDPYSGEHIYVPSEQYLAEIEAKEKEAREQIEEMNAQRSGPAVTDSYADDAMSESNSDESAEEIFDTSGMSQEELDAANEIYARLMAEAAADEAAKQAEIDAIMREQEATDADYNAETGSYSGLYGKKPMSQADEDALAAIMSSNSSHTKSIEDLIKENQ